MAQLTLNQAQQALQNSPVATVLLDVSQRVAWANNAAELMLGETARDLANRNFTEIVSGMFQTVSAQESVYYIPATGPRAERWVQTRSQAVEQGEVKYFVDVTESRRMKLQHERMMQQMMELAPVDPATGLLTPRSLMQNLEPLVSRSRRYNNPLSVVVMSVVSKSNVPVNTQKMLLAVGHVLKDQMRWADLISRSPTDDFVMVLPETSHESAQKLVDKIKSHMSEVRNPDAPEQGYAVEAGFGISSWQKGDDAQQLIKRAHEALALTRRAAGKNS